MRASRRQPGDAGAWEKPLKTPFSTPKTQVDAALKKNLDDSVSAIGDLAGRIDVMQGLPLNLMLMADMGKPRKSIGKREAEAAPLKAARTQLRHARALRHRRRRALC